jgi:hypothetical protein
LTILEFSAFQFLMKKKNQHFIIFNSDRNFKAAAAEKDDVI